MKTNRFAFLIITTVCFLTGDTLLNSLYAYDLTGVRITAIQAGSTIELDDFVITDLDTGAVSYSNDFQGNDLSAFKLVYKSDYTNADIEESYNASKTKIENGKLRIEATGGFNAAASMTYNSLPKNFSLEFKIQKLQWSGHWNLSLFDWNATGQVHWNMNGSTMETPRLSKDWEKHLTGTNISVSGQNTYRVVRSGDAISFYVNDVLQSSDNNFPVGQRPIDLTSGLVAHYPFDGNANDASGNGNHGTVNGASLGTDRHGISGNAYSFDGVDDSIQTPVPSNQPNVSFGGWFLTGSPNKMMSIIDSDVSGNYGRSIIANYDGSGSDTLDKSLSLQFHNSAVSSLGVLNASTWYHAFATFDESQNAKLFLNGQIVATATEQTSPDGTNFRLGTHSSPFYFEGTIDNVRIYNRALSAADVAGLYELERPKDSDFDGLFDTYETYLGTDPNVADTDGDGLNDGQEVTAGTNPKISDKTVIDAVKVNSANFGLAPLSNLTATGATPHTNGWYYQPEWGWVWTNANVFPYVYRSPLGGKQAGWLYFREGSAPPYFHDYATGTWSKLGE